MIILLRILCAELICNLLIPAPPPVQVPVTIPYTQEYQEPLPAWYNPWADDSVDNFCPRSSVPGGPWGMSWPVVPEGLRDFGPYPGGIHNGLDIKAPLETPIYAPVSGVVSWAGWNTWGYGNLVAIGAGEYQILLAHMSGVNVGCGQWVRQGDLIGYIGQTGASTFPHVHLEVIGHGLSHDPVQFLPPLNTEDLPG